METQKPGAGNLWWFGLAINSGDFKVCKKGKSYYNRYVGLEYYTRKKPFSLLIGRMRRTFDKDYKFFPVSFLIPEESETLEKYMKAHAKFTFICKPSKGKGGEGIFMIQKYSDIPERTWSFKERELLVQRYVKSPLLIDKKKFDLRVYALISGFNPITTYVAREGLARFCTSNYV